MTLVAKTGYVYVKGERVPVAAPTRTWRDDSAVPSFSGLPHRPETRAVMLHHTGGEGDAIQMHSVLVERKLSVPFHVDHTGLITQFCDTEARCQHAGAANGWSIGIEVQNRANGARMQKGVAREIVIERIHGMDAARTAFTAEQMASTLALTSVLCEAYGLPLRVPMNGKDVMATVLIEAELSVYRGVLGHLHVSRAKVDPGLAILRAIVGRQHWPAPDAP